MERSITTNEHIYSNALVWRFDAEHGKIPFWAPLPSLRTSQVQPHHRSWPPHLGDGTVIWSQQLPISRAKNPAHTAQHTNYFPSIKTGEKTITGGRLENRTLPGKQETVLERTTLFFFKYNDREMIIEKETPKKRLGSWNAAKSNLIFVPLNACDAKAPVQYEVPQYHLRQV